MEVATGCMVLLMPLHTQDVLVGHLCLGPRVGGEPFRAEDRALLATLSGQVAAIVRNVGLMAELREQVVELDRLNERLERAQEEERALLAADLHDEALQTALHLHRLIAADGRGRATTAQHLAVASEVVRQLRAVCHRVRPAILDELGLSAALDVLARELGARSGIPILLDVDPAVSELPLCRDAELVLYRAAQEAVNNVLRHASASRLEITVRCGPYGVRLDVADDGTGFAVPARLDGPPGTGGAAAAGAARGRKAGDRLRARPRHQCGGDPAGYGVRTMIRVTLVDDHLLMRQGTEALLAAAPEIAVVAQTARGEEALMLAREMLPEERDDRLATLEELGALAPVAIFRIRRCHALGVPRVPRIFRGTGLLRGGVGGEWWERWALWLLGVDDQ